MNYLQKKKLAFMSIVNSVKGFIRTITGVFPLTLTNCVDEESITDYTIYGNSVQNGTPTPDTPIEVESVGVKTNNLVTAEDGYVVKYDENNYISYAAATQEFTIHGSGFKSYFHFPETLPSGTVTSLYAEIVNSDYEFINGSLSVGGYGDNKDWQNVVHFTATSPKKQGSVYTITDATDKLCILVSGDSEVKNVRIRITYAVQSEPFKAYEPYNRYKIPITVSGNGKSVVTNIYLDEPLRKVGDYADYIDFENSNVVRNIAYERITTVTTKSSDRLVFLSPISQKPFVNSSGDRSVGYAMSDKFVRNTDTYGSLLSKAQFRDTAYIQTYITSSKANRVAYTFGDVSVTTVALAQEAIGDGFDVIYAVETPTETPITLPNIPTFRGTTVLSVGTTQPSNTEITYYSTLKG